MQSPGKVGLIGDVHCEEQSLDLAINTLMAEGVDAIVCTGDIPTGPGNINVCCDQLRRHQIPTVRGNHERWLLSLIPTALPFATMPAMVSTSSWQFLESLPPTLDFQTSHGWALLCHGIGAEDMLSIVPGQPDQDLEDHPVLCSIIESGRYRWMINGHSHRRMVRHFKSITIINAGTLRRDHDPGFAVADFESGRVDFWNLIDQCEVARAKSVALTA